MLFCMSCNYLLHSVTWRLVSQSPNLPNLSLIVDSVLCTVFFVSNLFDVILILGLPVIFFNNNKKVCKFSGQGSQPPYECPPVIYKA